MSVVLRFGLSLFWLLRPHMLARLTYQKARYCYWTIAVWYYQYRHWLADNEYDRWDDLKDSIRRFRQERDSDSRDS